MAWRNANQLFKVKVANFRYEQGVAKRRWQRYYRYMKQEDIKREDRRQRDIWKPRSPGFPRMSTGGSEFAPQRSWYEGQFKDACAKRAEAKAAALGAKRAKVAAMRRLAAARAAAAM